MHVLWCGLLAFLLFVEDNDDHIDNMTRWQLRYQYVDNDKFVLLLNYLINIIKEKLVQKVQSSLMNWNYYLHIWENMSHMVNINFEFGCKQGGGSQKYLETCVQQEFHWRCIFDISDRHWFHWSCILISSMTPRSESVQGNNSCKASNSNQRCDFLQGSFLLLQKSYNILPL